MFLKFEHIARPLGTLKEISVWHVNPAYVENESFKKNIKKLKLRLEFVDGSAWQFDLPEDIDREELLKKFLRAINRRTITDVPEVVEKLTKGVRK